MKTLTTIIVALGILFVPFKEQKAEVTLTVTIDGIRNSDGNITIALHNGESDFPGDEGFMMKSAEAKKGSIEVVFEKVPEGEYAIAVLHDENGNDEMDFNQYGMPIEGFGFSNEATAEMGPPEFDDASFEVSDDTDHSVEIVYMGM
ncbi:DUF2141 domain-containing protein [Roseivirga misakiensis]|uniref:DUF2141 domain-containing protein n=1 Tax=Roseivirga misakiensis TaxID=1563681 RepID=A0A1E5T6B4_9BACT|nr:DUF2141 domain-containing protein [Roseivirga misakiensis]OEK06934.1 hypothetical protein BFP71_04570 [Roseivirga misakiensis]